jgi:hypothetical protein
MTIAVKAAPHSKGINFMIQAAFAMLPFLLMRVVAYFLLCTKLVSSRISYFGTNTYVLRFWGASALMILLTTVFQTMVEFAHVIWIEMIKAGVKFTSFLWYGPIVAFLFGLGLIIIASIQIWPFGSIFVSVQQLQMMSQDLLIGTSQVITIIMFLIVTFFWSIGLILPYLMTKSAGTLKQAAHFVWTHMPFFLINSLCWLWLNYILAVSEVLNPTQTMIGRYQIFLALGDPILAALMSAYYQYAKRGQP